MSSNRIKLLTVYKRLLREFLRDSGTHGLKVFLFYTTVRHAKKLWFLFMMFIFISSHLIIINLIIEFVRQPTEMHMSTNLVHVANSPFPSVGICSANKISRRKLNAFAERVFQYQESYRPGLLATNVADMADHLLSLAGLYLYESDDMYETTIDSRLERLHNILAYMYNSSTYPTQEILRSFAPDCDELVIRGLLFGVAVNTTKYFIKRMTSLSACCMFNYLRKSYAIDPHVRKTEDAFTDRMERLIFQSNSILSSVQFVLQDDPDDYAYQSLANNAFQLYIIPQEDFATIQSSTSGEILINHNSIVEIPIQPEFIESRASIKAFSPQLRKCYFHEEGQRLLNKSFYSIDECLLICRMKSMVQYCGCVNPPLPGILIDANHCNLLDLACLTRWKSVWYRWNYFDYVDDEKDQRNAHTSAFEACQHCLATCNGVEYKIYINELPLRQKLHATYTQGLLKGLTNDKPLAIIKLYFKQRYAQSTQEDIVGDWVVLLNRFGGIMSLMYGFSIITYVELLYFASGKCFVHIVRVLKAKRRKSSASSDLSGETQTKVAELYWSEMVAPKNVNTKWIALITALKSQRERTE